MEELECVWIKYLLKKYGDFSADKPYNRSKYEACRKCLYLKITRTLQSFHFLHLIKKQRTTFLPNFPWKAFEANGSSKLWFTQALALKK